MNRSWRVDAAVVAGLLLLAFVPVLAGSVRLTMLAGGAVATPETARFVSAPVPVVIHIVSVSIYALLGAFQFAAGIRRKHPAWHRRAGRVLVVAGIAAALSGLWMAQFYAIVPADHPIGHLFRMLAGSAMLGSILIGFAAIRRGDVGTHQDWMRRAYAIGMGAGTQVFVILPPTLIFGPQAPLPYALEMGLAWAINIAVAEWLIARRRRPRAVFA
jgi:uncharacterized membrane protein